MTKIYNETIEAEIAQLRKENAYFRKILKLDPNEIIFIKDESTN